MKAPAFQFYTGDWKKDPELSMCGPATRGIWLDLLCAMHDLKSGGVVTGTVKQLAVIGRCTEAEMLAAIVEIIDTNVADVELQSVTGGVTNRNADRNAKRNAVTVANTKVTLINRRQEKVAKKKSNSALRQERYRQRMKGDAGSDAPSSSSTSVTSSNDDVVTPTTPPLRLADEVPNPPPQIPLLDQVTAAAAFAAQTAAGSIEQHAAEALRDVHYFIPALQRLYTDRRPMLKPPDSFKPLMDDFLAHRRTEGKEFDNRPGFRAHFKNWLKIQIEKTGVALPPSMPKPASNLSKYDRKPAS